MSCSICSSSDGCPVVDGVASIIEGGEVGDDVGYKWAMYLPSGRTMTPPPIDLAFVACGAIFFLSAGITIYTGFKYLEKIESSFGRSQILRDFNYRLRYWGYWGRQMRMG